MAQLQRVILSGGGTGGHIYPALALYRHLKTINPEIEVLYIGTQKGLESMIVPKEGIAFKTIEISGLKRSLSPKNFQTLWQMLTATHKAKKLIKDFKPDVVLGTGGYVCGPVLLAASRLGIPTIIHEQNSVAGITNKFLASHVTGIATCFESVHPDFAKHSSKVRLIGNPRGQEVLQTPKEDHLLADKFHLKDDKATILVFGGSRGAPAINQAALESVAKWRGQDYQVIIVTGRDHYQDFMDQLGMDPETLDNIRILPYVDNMPALFQKVDLVVCRSGATTLTELMALGIPSVLIPSPYVTNNHQETNAMTLVNAGAGQMIRQSELSSETLFDTCHLIIQDPDKICDMRQAAKKLGKPHASQDLADWMQEITK